MNKHEEIDFIYFNFASYVLSVYTRGRHFRLYGCQTTCRQRVEALLAQMTLEEKVGQMDMVTVWDKEAIFKNGYYDFGAWLADLEPEECNQLQNCPNKPV